MLDDLRMQASAAQDPALKMALSSRADAVAAASSDLSLKALESCAGVALDLLPVNVLNKLRKVGAKLLDYILHRGGKLAEESRAFAKAAQSKLDDVLKAADEAVRHGSKARDTRARARAVEASITIRAAEAEDESAAADKLASDDRSRVDQHVQQIFAAFSASSL